MSWKSSDFLSFTFSTLETINLCRNKLLVFWVLSNSVHEWCHIRSNYFSAELGRILEEDISNISLQLFSSNESSWVICCCIYWKTCQHYHLKLICNLYIYVPLECSVLENSYIGAYISAWPPVWFHSCLEATLHLGCSGAANIQML